MELAELTISEFHEALVSKKFSAFEATEYFLGAIEKKDPEIKAYLRLTKDLALSRASMVDVEIAEGRALGMMAGVPLAIKDNILIQDELATAASKILSNHRAVYDATVIKKLKEARAVFLGKTNLDEFAMGSSTENSAFQVTKNPYDKERVPGGSSGGSAAAVASRMAVAALGSDTGGSIRQPASFCGVVGLKPTYGAVSRYGLIAMASSLDQIGPITKTVHDAAILFKEISARDEFDSTSCDVTYGDELLNPHLDQIRKLKIGIPKEFFLGGLDRDSSLAIEEAIKTLKSLKLEFQEISLPYAKYSLSVYYIIMFAEVSANLARFDGIRYSRTHNSQSSSVKLWDVYFDERSKGFGEEAKRRIMLGTYVLSAGYYDTYYAKAQKVRQLINEDFDRAFDPAAGGVDVILAPVSPTTAFKVGEKIDDPLSMYLSDIFTIPVNLTGLPAVSIPVENYQKLKFQNSHLRQGLPDSVVQAGFGGRAKLPVGFQLIGRPFHEADILGIGHYYEEIRK